MTLFTPYLDKATVKKYRWAMITGTQVTPSEIERLKARVAETSGAVVQGSYDNCPFRAKQGLACNGEAAEPTRAVLEREYGS